jgi:hypothetical protein
LLVLLLGGPAGGGLMSSMTPILAGAGTGALLAAAKGDDPLMGGLTGGLGGYGGSQLGSTFGKAFGGTGGTTAGAMDDIIAAGAQQTTGGAGNVGMFTAGNMGAGAGVGPQTAFGQAGTYAQAVPNLGVTANTPNPFTGAGGFDSAAKTVTGGGGYSTAPLELAGDNISNLGSGVKNLTGFGDMSIGDAYSKFTQAGGTAGQLAMPVGGAVLAGLEPSDLGYGTGNFYEDPEKGKYRGPQGQLNLSDQFDTGLRLATGGSIQSGGIRDLYGTPDNQPTISPGLSGFGLGRLNNLAGEQAMTQAQTLGYDEGGAVGSGDASGDTSGDAVTAETTSAPADYASMSYDALVASGIHPMNAAALKGMPMPGMSSPAPSTYTGSGSSTSGISSLAPSISYMPTTSYGTGTPEYIGGMPSASYIESMGYRGGMPSPDYIESMGYSGGMPSPSLSAGFGGLRKRIDYAKGGYLDGAGDGMSDSIPATIEGKQPARLADGEFVVPADVVSHLGNGSSKAGSKRLYAMLDKVRHARTGNKKQGKEINPAKYMPA